MLGSGLPMFGLVRLLASVCMTGRVHAVFQALCAAYQAASQRHFDMSDATAGELTWATFPVGHGYANLFVCPDARHAFIVDMGR